MGDGTKIADTGVTRYDVVKDGFGGYFAGLSPADWGTYVRYADHIAALSAAEERERVLRVALGEAAESLNTIATKAGKDEYMKDVYDVRGYANSRATVARAALATPAPEQPSAEGAKNE